MRITDPIEKTNLSGRTKGALIRNGFRTINDILQLSEYELSQIDHLGPMAVCEIVEFIKDFGKDGSDPYKNYDKWISENQEKVKEYICGKDISIEDMDLTTRTYNILRMNNKYHLSDLLGLDPSTLKHGVLGRFGAEEIKGFLKDYLRENRPEIIAFVGADDAASKSFQLPDVAAETPAEPPVASAQSHEDMPQNSLPVQSKVETPQKEYVEEAKKQPHAEHRDIAPDTFEGWVELNKDVISDYVQKNDALINESDICPRTRNMLRNMIGMHRVFRLSEFLSFNFCTLKNGALREAGAQEVCNIVKKYVLDNFGEIAALAASTGKRLTPMPAEQPQTEPEERKQQEKVKRSKRVVISYAEPQEEPAPVSPVVKEDISVHQPEPEDAEADETIDAEIERDKQKIIAYLQENDVSYKELGLSKSVDYVLRRTWVRSVSRLFQHYLDGFKGIDGIGKVERREISEKLVQFVKSSKSLYESMYERKETPEQVSTSDPLTHSEEISVHNSTADNPEETVSATATEPETRAQADVTQPSEQPPVEVDAVGEYLRMNAFGIDELDLSLRPYNALRKAGIHTIADLYAMHPEAYLQLPGLGRGSQEEIKARLEAFLRSKQVNNTAGGIEETKPDAQKPAMVDAIGEYLRANAFSIDLLGLSTRPYNALRRARIHTIADLYAVRPEGYMQFPNLGKGSQEEIEKKLDAFLRSKQEHIAASNSGEILIEPDDTEAHNVEDALAEVDFEIDQHISEEIATMTVAELLSHKQYAEFVRRFYQTFDIPITTLNLSVRSFNAMMKYGYESFSKMLTLYPDGFSALRGLGNLSINEIKTIIETTVEKNREKIIGFCSSNKNAMYTDDYIRETVLAQFPQNAFVGLSFKELRKEFPEDIEDERVKAAVGKLLSEHVLEYVDYRVYRVYPSFYEVLDAVEAELEKDEHEIISRKFSGLTLEAIGEIFDVSRERIRQKLSKALRKVKTIHACKNGLKIFDEDYYAYLYSNYEISKECWFDFIGISQSTYTYLRECYKRGSQNLEDVLEDTSVDISLKFKIRDYLNRNKIIVDGVMMDATRAVLENFIISRYCKDDTPYEEFFELFNGVLQANDIPYNKDIYYTEEIIRSRYNRIAESRVCLWKQGRMLRYYDLDGSDFTELLDTINLDSFENTEVSTLKFIKKYPELMQKYDIRDQYELHNLLKKTVNEGAYHNIDFHRQPVITFGEFDREKAIEEILFAFAPISQEELAEYIHDEYGYDKATIIASYLVPFSKYYHNGMYSVDFKNIPDDRKALFADALTEDFYFTEDVKKLYAKMFPGADLEEVNAYSLKSMGFVVLSNYVVQHHATAVDFFKYVLTKDDVFSTRGELKRYNSITIYSQIFAELKRSYDILAFDKDEYINFRRLEKLGFTKEDIHSFCEEVCEAVEEETYFTMRSLRNAGFTFDLDALGFDDWFFSNILAVNEKFSYQRVYGEIVLYKTSSPAVFSINTFIRALLSEYESVDVDDFIDDCKYEYGIKIPDRHEVTGAVSGTSFYYDAIMGKIYRNKSLYYEEFDD